MTRGYFTQSHKSPLRVFVMGPQGCIAVFRQRKAEANATTLCDQLNRAYDLGMAAGMATVPISGLHSGGY